MKYYAVLDTNVIVSSLLKSDSIPSQVTQEALNGDILPVLNDGILQEYEDVLQRPKFNFDKNVVSFLLNELKRRAVFVDQGLIEDVIPDPKDVVFYAVLMEKRKEEEAYLVTGNIKHYPARTYVVTPREMLDILQEGLEEGVEEPTDGDAGESVEEPVEQGAE